MFLLHRFAQSAGPVVYEMPWDKALPCDGAALSQVVPPRPGMIVAQCPHNAGQFAPWAWHRFLSFRGHRPTACSSYVRAILVHLAIAISSCCKYHYWGHVSLFSVAWRVNYEWRVTLKSQSSTAGLVGAFRHGTTDAESRSVECAI